MSSPVAHRQVGMAYASVNGLQLYHEIHGSGRPLVLLHGGLMTIDLHFGAMLDPRGADRQVVGVELQGHGPTAARTARWRSRPTPLTSSGCSTTWRSPRPTSSASA